MRIKLKRIIKGSKGTYLTPDKTTYSILDVQVRKKRYLIEVKNKSWFIDFKDAEVI